VAFGVFNILKNIPYAALEELTEGGINDYRIAPSTVSENVGISTTFLVKYLSKKHDISPRPDAHQNILGKEYPAGTTELH
jgi:hypothetical protein